jgi:acetyl esterase
VWGRCKAFSLAYREDQLGTNVDRVTATSPRAPTTSGRNRHPRLRRASLAALVAGTRLGATVLRDVPGKRLLAGGRAITVDGNTLDATLQMMLATQKALGQHGLTMADDVELSRRRIRALAAAIDHKTVPVRSVTALRIPGPAGPIRARHYRPAGADVAPLMVFYHGGGWVICDLDTHDGLCRLLCSGAGIHVLSIDYRLAPEHPAPAGVDDGYAAFRWAHEHAGELGGEPGRVLVGGDSAGGNISALVAQRGRDDGTPPALQLLLYPVTDLRGGTRSRALFADGFYLRAADMRFCQSQLLTTSGLDAADPRVSPLLADDLSGLPPAIVVTAGFDPLRDEGEQYADAMRGAGTVVDLRRFGSLIHAFANMAPLGGGSAVAMAEVVSALRAHLCHR